jgi:CRP/FNR family cyclic AMP-dependent transcriptional regulator
MHVSPSMWARLVETGTRVRFGTGEVVLRQGDPSSHVALLVTGAVKVLLYLPEGRSLLLAVRGPGEVLGVMGVVSGAPRSATVIAAGPCLTRVLSAQRFLAFMRAAGEEPMLLRRAMLRIREGEEWRAETATLPARPKVARALLRLAVPTGKSRCEVPLSQAEIGAAVGMSRGAVALELAGLREAGLVETTLRRVVILDPAGLRDLAALGREAV